MKISRRRHLLGSNRATRSWRTRNNVTCIYAEVLRCTRIVALKPDPGLLMRFQNYPMHAPRLAPNALAGHSYFDAPFLADVFHQTIFRSNKPIETTFSQPYPHKIATEVAGAIHETRSQKNRTIANDDTLH